MAVNIFFSEDDGCTFFRKLGTYQPS